MMDGLRVYPAEISVGSKHFRLLAEYMEARKGHASTRTSRLSIKPTGWSETHLEGLLHEPVRSLVDLYDKMRNIS